MAFHFVNVAIIRVYPMFRQLLITKQKKALQKTSRTWGIFKG